MKLTRLFLTTAVLSVATLLPATASAGKAIPIDQSEVLQIVVQDNVMRKRNDYWTTSRMDTERYVMMKDALERSIKKADYKGPIKIERLAGGVKDAHQQLTLYVYRWEQGIESFGTSVTVEFAMEATLVIGDEEWDMGAFTARNSHTSLSPDIEDYRPAAERAIEQLIELYRNAIGKTSAMGK